MISYFFRQLILALTVVAGCLLFGEILIPGLVLPFLNLHLFVIAVLAMNLIPFGSETNIWMRLLSIIPVALVLIGYAFLLLSGQGPSAMLLGVAFVILIISACVAITYEHGTV